jgi:hypothetical protein
LNTYKKSFILIAAILAVVATLLLIALRGTPLIEFAYVFVLVGIIGLLCSGFFVLKNGGAYPWIAAVPRAAYQYLAANIVISVICVILAGTGLYILPKIWFIVIHVIVLAFFSIRIIMLNAGKQEINRVEEKVRETTFDWKMLRADMEALAEQYSDVKPLLEAIRYSDPVSSPKLAEYDAQIRDGVAVLEQAVAKGENVAEAVSTLLRRIKDRNNRAKLLK